MQDREQAFSVVAVKVEHLSPVSTLELPRAYRFHQVLGSPSRRSLGCKSQSVATPSGSVEMMRKVETYLEALQDERRKIEAFKRELPLCMQLLDHAIEASREQLVDLDNRPLKATPGGSESCEGRDSSVIQCSNVSTPRTEGVTPVTAKWDKLRTERHYDKDKQQKSKSVASNKPSWMVEGHLWDQPCGDASHRQEKSSTVTEEIGLRSGDVDAEQATSCSPRLALSSRQRPAGAFLPFIREKPSARPPSTHSDAAACNGTDLSLSSPGDGERTSASGRSASGVGMSLDEVGSMDGCLVRQKKYAAAAQVQTAEALCGVEGGPAASTTTSSSGQASRKARRCWSPELHRRFVGALQQLGGAQVATPKQIRELMKVDGLTNDEVKSHLQKYRLHTRRPSPAPQAAGSQAPQLVVLGGIWMPPEYAAAAAAAQQSSPPGMSGVPPFCPPALSTQEYYSHLSHQPTQLQLRQSPFYEQQQAASQTQSSPNAPKLSSSPRDCANSNHSCADDSAGEEGKSESTSWKGENGVQEDDGEEGDMTVARKNTNLQSREDGKSGSPIDTEEVQRAKLDITL